MSVSNFWTGIVKGVKGQLNKVKERKKIKEIHSTLTLLSIKLLTQ